MSQTIHDQIVFFASSASDGERDNMISALKLITNLMKGQKLGKVVKSVEDGSKRKVNNALRHLFSADNKRAFVTMVMRPNTKKRKHSESEL